MIYFIRRGDSTVVKIGRSVSPNKRLAQLQTGSDVRLELIGVLPGYDDEERRWHGRFADRRLAGEWFDLTPEAIESIREEASRRGGTPDKKEQEFRRLCDLEPGLVVLAREAERHRRSRKHPFCANAIWYGYRPIQGIKPRLLPLVGWMRQDGHEVLKSKWAYDVAYDAIYERLPDCDDNCACQTFLRAALS